MTELEKTQKQIKKLLLQAKKPLLLSHIRPDGDAIGSLIGFSLALQTMGKKPQAVLGDGLPRRFGFINGSNIVKQKIQGEYDLLITVDCADKNRVGFPNNLPPVDINIDHHITNEEYAKINFVLPKQASTSAILAKFLPQWGFEINKSVADALLMGMITDTIGFRTSNVTPEFLKLAANLIEKGADLPNIYHKALTIQSLSASLLWGFALSRLKHDNNLAWTSITLKDRKEANYPGRDDADLTNHLSSLDKIDVSILFNEQKDGKVKVSWRSNDKHDVSQIAVAFNGGGHPPAAGAEIVGKLEAVIDEVLEKTRKFIQGKK